MAFRRGLAPIVIAVAIALVYWPGLQGFWTRDDFMQLAFARLVGSPWAVFVHDHYFPAPGSIFRPLGFASFWLSQALFGTDYFWNAFGDLVLHVGVALALYRVIRAGAIERVPAVLCTLLFALHPAVLGTALWWSARFDLLAMLFGLVAVRAGIDYSRQPRTSTMFVVLIASLAALLSKETALAAVAAVALVLLFGAFRPGASRREDLLRTLGALCGLVGVFFAWRTAVLGTLTTGLAGDASIVDAFGRGLVAWSAHLLDYVTFGPRSGIVVAVVIAAYFVLEFERLKRDRHEAEVPGASRVDIVMCGICLFVLPAILQAPIAAMNATPLHADASAVEAAMQSRLYYFSIGGLAIMFAAGVGRLWSGTRIPHAALNAALAFCAGVFGWVSHDASTGFANRTAASRPLAEGISAAIDHAAPSTAARCRIVVLGVQPPAEWSVYVSIDSIAKALTADPDRVGRCFVESDYVMYFNLVRGEASPADALPYTPRRTSDRQIPWLRIGDMTAAYLDPPADVDTAKLAGITFLRYENGAFVDVTNDVASGAMPVTLR